MCVNHRRSQTEDREKNSKSVAILNNRIEAADPLPPPGAEDQLLASSGINVCDRNDLLVSGNTIVGEFPTAGIRLLRCQQGTVAANSISGKEFWDGEQEMLTGSGILLNGTQEMSVTANSIRGYATGIFEIVASFKEEEESPPVQVHCSRNTVTGNILTNNGQAVGGTPPANSVYTANITG